MPESKDVLLSVFETMDESEAMIVKGLLESSGISALITPIDAPQDVLPGVGGVVIRVASEQAEEAGRLIADSGKAGELLSDHGSVSDHSV